MTWPSHDLTPQQTSRHQNTSLQSTKHHQHGTAEGSFTAKKWFGHRAGRSPCAHFIGKFFLCYTILFLLETSAPGLSGHYWKMKNTNCLGIGDNTSLCCYNKWLIGGVGWWFGFQGSLYESYYKLLLVRGTPLKSQNTKPNHQFAIGWRHSRQNMMQDYPLSPGLILWLVAK